MSRMDGKKTHTHCRESVGTGPVVLKAVRVTGAAFASPRTKCYCAPLFSHTHYCCGDAKAAPVTRTALRTTGTVPTDSRQCVCVFFPSILTSSSLDVPAGVTQEEGHTGFLIHLPSAVRALIFVARRIQPFLSLVDREVEFCVLTN